MVWIPGIPLWKGLLLRGTPGIPNHQPKNTHLPLVEVTFTNQKISSLCTRGFHGAKNRHTRNTRGAKVWFPFPHVLELQLQVAKFITGFSDTCGGPCLVCGFLNRKMPLGGRYSLGEKDPKDPSNPPHGEAPKRTGLSPEKPKGDVFTEEWRKASRASEN